MSVVANETYFGRAVLVRQSAGLALAETHYDGGTVVPQHAHETALCVLVLEAGATRVRRSPHSSGGFGWSTPPSDSCAMTRRSVGSVSRLASRTTVTSRARSSARLERRRLPIASCSVHREQGRILDKLLHPNEEEHGLLTIDDAMVIR